LILFISNLSIQGFNPESKYGIVKLNAGLPKEAEKQSKSFIEPYYASIPTNKAFKKVYVLWDKAKPKSYRLFVVHNDEFWSFIGTSFKKNDDHFYSDSLSFQNRDDYKSIVPYQIKLDVKKQELHYYWSKSKEKGIKEEGGFPQFIKPRLCKGKMMPEFNFKTFDGETISSKKLRGKFIFIDFWGTWCGGCIYEMPYVKEMREKISTSKLFVVGFVNDNKDSLKKYLSKNSFNYPNVLLDSLYLEKCEVQSYPTKVLIDPEGMIISTDFYGEKLTEMVLTKINNYKK
jgi:thiol-disulfide isomerase/thioredoxin